MARYASISRDELVARLTAQTGPTFWGSSEKVDAVNEALNVWQAMTGSMVGNATILLNGASSYTIPSQFATLQQVLYGTTPLFYATAFELDHLRSGWESETGDPEFWTSSGLTSLSLVPNPTSGTLKLYGVLETGALGSGGDTVDLGEEEVLRILDYAQHYLAFKEATQELTSSAEMQKKFLEAAAKRNGRLQATSLYRRTMGLDKEGGERPSEKEPTVGIR